MHELSETEDVIMTVCDFIDKHVVTLALMIGCAVTATIAVFWISAQELTRSEIVRSLFGGENDDTHL